MAKIKVPVAVSNRHIHLTKEDLSLLFGERYELKKRNDLTQPGQFAAEETVRVCGPKAEFSRVRIIGPTRNYTQLEISGSDALVLGIDPPTGFAGQADGSAEVLIVGPYGEIKRACAIISMRHLHCSVADAKVYGLTDGQLLSVTVNSERGVTFHRVKVRVGNFSTEVHLDTDEGNGAGIVRGATGELLVESGLMAANG